MNSEADSLSEKNDVGSQETTNDVVDSIDQVKDDAVVGEEKSQDEAVGDSKEISDREKYARSLGWKPKSEFRHDTKKFIDYDEFIRRTENEAPILRDTLRKQAKKIDELSSSLFELKELSHKQILREREEALKKAEKEIEDRLRKAEEDYDLEKFKSASIDREQFKIEKEEFENEKRSYEEKAKKYSQNELQQKIETWFGNPENQWAIKDQALFKVFETYVGEIERSNPSLDFESILTEAEKRIKTRFPYEFNSAKESSTDKKFQSVEPGSSAGLGLVNQRKVSFDDLPSDIKDIAKRTIRQMIDFKKSREKNFNEVEFIKKMKTQYIEEYLGSK